MSADSIVGGTFARFRLSTVGGLTPRGQANDGEVEDYAVTLIAAGGDTTIASPTGGGPISIKTVGNNIVVEQDGVILSQVPADEAGPIALVGTPGTDDFFIVDFTNGDPIPAGGLFFDGAEGTGDNDKLIVRGDGSVAVYSPDVTNDGAGTVQVGSTLIHFTNLEPVDIFGMVSVTIDLPSGDDVINVVNGFDLTGTGTDSIAINGNVTLPGTLKASLNGDLTQAGAGSKLTIGGTTTLSSGTGNVSLRSPPQNGLALQSANVTFLSRPTM